VRPSLRNSLNLYVSIVITACLAAMALALHIDWGVAPLGVRPAAFIAFLVLAVTAEALPLTWLSGQDGGQTTASWAFLFSMLLMAPLSTGLACSFLASASVDVAHRRPVTRTLFNASQGCLSLALGMAGMRAITDPLLIVHGHSPTVRWLAGIAVAGGVAFTLNTLFLCVALALAKHLPVLSVIREAIGVSLAMDLILIALAPVFTVMAVHAIVLMPLLLLAAVGIYQSAKVALSHRHEATHDLLTELPNRRLYYSQSTLAIEKARSGGRRLAVLLLDLDGFKGINDRLGHAVGDLVLGVVSQRVEAIRKTGDVVARLGGDEFAFLLTGDPDRSSSLRFANDIVRQLEAPLSVEGVPVSISGSIGLALFPEHGDDIDTLLRHADTAMYRAKTGPSRTQTYDDRQDRHGPTRLGLLSELSRAIENGELFVVYQPKISLATNLPVGVETLLRWRHPTRGEIMPDLFVAGAEQTELMGPITEFVIRTATRQAAEWRAAGIDMNVAVNASARNLHDIKFPAMVRSALRESQLDGTGLEIEITENTVMTDPDRTAAVLGHLRSLGVQLSIDDFGTGYSSLAHLRSLPIDRIKIDRTFITNMIENADDLTIVRSIIDLAQNLALGTIGEGVETADVLDRLRELGCEAAQGYLIAPPTTAAGAADFYRRARPVPVPVPTIGGER
jgi:diguanylate cyclase (GGDEF)-like protein